MVRYQLITVTSIHHYFKSKLHESSSLRRNARSNVTDVQYAQMKLKINTTRFIDRCVAYSSWSNFVTRHAEHLERYASSSFGEIIRFRCSSWDLPLCVVSKFSWALIFMPLQETRKYTGSVSSFKRDGIINLQRQ